MRDRLALLFKPTGLQRIIRFLLLAGFAWAVLGFWDPYFRFTRFLQIDPRVAQRAIPQFRDPTFFVSDQAGSYDGAYYAQIATDPTLRDPALGGGAIDDLGYRARRILLPATAWGLAGGQPVAAVRCYSVMNVVLWFVFSALLWRVFPVGEWRGTAAWLLMLTGGGVLLSVRLALTDLLALLLTAGAVLAVESGRGRVATALVGFGGLARETAVLGVSALLPWGAGAKGGRRWLGFLLRGTLAVLPLILWLAYLRHVAGGSGAGSQNISWPFSGWAHRWYELWQDQEVIGNLQLQIESVLEHVALTVQLVYLALRPRKDYPWWRVGAAYAVLLALLGGAVWDGFPNAASRVLLPLTLAFNVCAVRDRARWGWLLAGNLAVFAGLHALYPAAEPPHLLPSHSTWASRHLLQTDDRWSVAEWNSKHRWAWCAGEGGLLFRADPPRARVKLELSVRGVTPRPLEVWVGKSQVWSGRIGDRPEWIALPELPMQDGKLELELRSPIAARSEGAENTAREISFACFGARLVEQTHETAPANQP